MSWIYICIPQAALQDMAQLTHCLTHLHRPKTARWLSSHDHYFHPIVRLTIMVFVSRVRCLDLFVSYLILFLMRARI